MEDDWTYTKTGPKQQLQRRRAKPKTTWRQTVEKERAEAGWRSWQEVKTVAAD